MHLFLLSFCLVGLGQAGPTTPAFFTDTLITRSLHDPTDARVTKVTWTENNSTNSSETEPKFDIELCHDQVASFNKETTIGFANDVQLGQVDEVVKEKPCYIFKNKDKIAVDGEAVKFGLWDLKDTNNFAVGTISHFSSVTKVTKDLNCDGEEGPDAITFGSEDAQTPYKDKILFCLPSKECVFKSSGYPFVMEKSSSDVDVFCTPKETGEEHQMKYCQQVEVANAGALKVKSINYAKYEIESKEAFADNSYVVLCKPEGKINTLSRSVHGKRTIALIDPDKQPSENLYTVIAKPPNGMLSIGSIQDLSLKVEKKKFDGKPFYLFNFRHKQDHGNSYVATSGSATKNFTCENEDGLCYSFLQPTVDGPFQLSYGDDTNQINAP